ncbi:MAG: methyl-accepting chemotaxis protein [Candidatus Adiutrix sp.]|jgi:methyl-accepting chemotaxis protein|nr:methyl-accepting chemotaxis protein [Candidatus Adiutrix sp.]
MSLSLKIILAFFIMVLLAIGASVSGWRSATEMSIALDEVDNFFMPLGEGILSLQYRLEQVRGQERTLISPGLSLAERRNQLDLHTQADQLATAAIGNIDRMLEDGRGKGFAAPRTEAAWLDARKKLLTWKNADAELIAIFEEWDKTRILAPDRLLADLNGFRGDHYALASRLGTMLAEGRVSGPAVNASDSACAFGQWRIRFDESLSQHQKSRDPDKPIALSDGSPGIEYVKNQAIAREMEAMIPDHAAFHQGAHDIYALLATGDTAGASRRYTSMVIAAGKVIGRFETLAREAQAAQTRVRESQDKVMVEIQAMQETALNALALTVESCSSESDAVTAAATKAGSSAIGLAKTLLVAAIIFGLGLAVFLVFTIQHGLIRPLADIIDGLSGEVADMVDSSGALARESNALSEGASDQAVSLEETSATLEQMSSMTRKNADNTTRTSQTTAQTLKFIEDGRTAVNNMSQAMGEINDSAEEIGRIIKAIEEIAFQTNLLALNAAVEAARAGEAGLGFAVVADEVRNLAQRAAQAAHDTSDLIAGTVSRIRNGFEIATALDASFKEISAGAKDVGTLITEISTATNEQAQGVGQINTAVSHIDQVTQKSAASSEELASTSAQISNQAEHIHDYVDRLAQVLGRRLDSGPAGPARPAKTLAAGKTPKMLG